jgi:hypothetical protein
MLTRNKIILAIGVSMSSWSVMAQVVPPAGRLATDGNDIIGNIVTFFGSLGYGILALMVLVGLYCLFVFGTSLMKMGDENERDKVKPQTLITSLAGALVLTYGSYTLGVAMQTAFGGDASTTQNRSEFNRTR